MAVSAGCLAYLTCEELQGVIGHEFSHILNGDMRLNLRLIGIVYGILVLSIVGYYMLRAAGGSSDDRKSGLPVVLFFAGLAFMILGYLGVFFGNIIKAAISRHREFLGRRFFGPIHALSGRNRRALKKIGGLSEGSLIRDAHASEISHMFFGEAMSSSLFHLFATHPPLVERIRALEPDFDGAFPDVEPLAVGDEAANTAHPIVSPFAQGNGPTATSGVQRPPMAAGPQSGTAPKGVGALDAVAMMQQIGRPGEEHLQQASRLIGNIPPALAAAVREPFTAQAVVYSLLFSGGDAAVRAKQWALLQGQIEPALYQQTQQMADAARALPDETRLPLVDLAIPALKQLSPQQYAKFRQAVETLVAADGRIDLFEYCLRHGVVRLFGRSVPAEEAGDGPLSDGRRRRAALGRRAFDVGLRRAGASGGCGAGVSSRRKIGLHRPRFCRGRNARSKNLTPPWGNWPRPARPSSGTFSPRSRPALPRTAA